MGQITPGPLTDFDLVSQPAANFAFATDRTTLNPAVGSGELAYIPYIELFFSSAGGSLEVRVYPTGGVEYFSIAIAAIEAGSYKFVGPWWLQIGGYIAVETAGNADNKWMQTFHESNSTRRNFGPVGVPLKDGGVLINGMGTLINAIGKHDEQVAHPEAMKVLYEGTPFDGAAFTAVSLDGDLTRPKASMEGVPFSTPVSPDGSETPLGSTDVAVEDGLWQDSYRSTIQDGVAFPAPATTEGRNVQKKGSMYGIGYQSLVDQTGRYTPHNSQATAVEDGGLQTLGEVKVVDGDPLDNQGANGQAVRPAFTEGGARHTMPVSPTGDTTAYANVDQPVQTGAIQSAGRAEEIDGDAFDGAVADGDAVLARRSLSGISYVNETTEDGSASIVDEIGLAKRVEVINGIPYQYDPDTPINEESIPTNTTSYAYFDMSGYKYFSLQGVISLTVDTLTVTVEATVQDDGTAQASCAYEDVTNALFGVASAGADFL